MNIEKVNSAPSFSGLNIKRVAQEHMQFINKDFVELKKLGDQYDISMKSYIDSEYRCDGIEITVKNLKKNLSFFKRFNRPKGNSYFYTTPHYTADTKNMTFLGQIQKAIDNLSQKTI